MSIKPLSEQRSLFEAGVYLGDMLDREKGSERFRFFSRMYGRRCWVWGRRLIRCTAPITGDPPRIRCAYWA